MLALVALVQKAGSLIHSFWQQYQPALRQKVTFVRGSSPTLLKWSPASTKELNTYGTYVQAVYDEVHRLNAHIQATHVCPQVYIRGRGYLVNHVEFESNELWYYCTARMTPFVHEVFHKPVDLVWHMVLTGMGEPRHPYFADKTL